MNTLNDNAAVGMGGTIGADDGVGAGVVLDGMISAMGAAVGACGMWPESSHDWAENGAVGNPVEIQADHWCSASSSVNTEREP